MSPRVALQHDHQRRRPDHRPPCIEVARRDRVDRQVEEVHPVRGVSMAGRGSRGGLASGCRSPPRSRPPQRRRRAGARRRGSAGRATAPRDWSPPGRAQERYPGSVNSAVANRSAGGWRVAKAFSGVRSRELTEPEAVPPDQAGEEERVFSHPFCSAPIRDTRRGWRLWRRRSATVEVALAAMARGCRGRSATGRWRSSRAPRHRVHHPRAEGGGDQDQDLRRRPHEGKDIRVEPSSRR